MATHQLETESDVEAYAAEHLFLGTRQYTVDPNFGSEMSVSIAIGVNQAVIFGAWFEPILGKAIVATASVRSELRLIEAS
jgi:hypothetical protein